MIAKKEKDFNFRVTITLNRSDILKALKAKGANTEYLEELLAWMRGFNGQKSVIALDADVKEDEYYVDTLADIISDYHELLQEKAEDVKEENAVCSEDEGDEDEEDDEEEDEDREKEAFNDLADSLLARVKALSAIAESLASFVPDEKKK